MKKRIYSAFKRFIAGAMTLCFFVNTCFADVSGLSLDFSFKAERPQLIQIDIPAELASVDEFWEAPSHPNPKMILHIQNAHTNYEAQNKIRDLMTYLNANYGFKTIFVEGASENLNPEYLKLFPDAETNRKLWDELAKRGQITGADWFLLQGAKDAKGVGIENAELYRKNYDALKAVYSRESGTSRFLDGLESELDKLASKMLSPATRKIIAEWKKFEKGHREFIPFVESLAKLAKENLNLDLHGLYSQIEWPQMTRILVLQEMEKKLETKRSQAESERQQMLVWMKKNNIRKELIEGLERFNEKNINMNRIRASSGKMEILPRFFIEKLIQEAGPKGLKFSSYPNFALYIGQMILRYEIEPPALFEEIRRLFEKLLNETQNETVKPLIELFHDAELVRKLFNLELSRAEWGTVLARKVEVEPSKIFKRLKAFENQQTGVPAKPSEYQKEILTAFENAFSFYDLAIRRDEVFYEKISKELETTDRAILMTGGFHSEGMKEIFRDKEISYGTITPRLTQIEKSNLYRDVMLGKSSAKLSPPKLSMVEIWSLLNEAGLEPDRMGFTVENISKAIAAALGDKAFDGNFIAKQLNEGLFKEQGVEVVYNGRGFEIKARSEFREPVKVAGSGRVRTSDKSYFDLYRARLQDYYNQNAPERTGLLSVIGQGLGWALGLPVALISWTVLAVIIGDGEIYKNVSDLILAIFTKHYFFTAALVGAAYWRLNSVIKNYRNPPIELNDFLNELEKAAPELTLNTPYSFDELERAKVLDELTLAYKSEALNLDALQLLLQFRFSQKKEVYLNLLERMRYLHTTRAFTTAVNLFDVALVSLLKDSSGLSGKNSWKNKLGDRQSAGRVLKLLNEYVAVHPQNDSALLDGIAATAGRLRFIFEYFGLNLRHGKISDRPQKDLFSQEGTYTFEIKDGDQTYVLKARKDPDQNLRFLDIQPKRSEMREVLMRYGVAFNEGENDAAAVLKVLNPLPVNMVSAAQLRELVVPDYVSGAYVNGDIKETEQYDRNRRYKLGLFARELEKAVKGGFFQGDQSKAAQDFEELLDAFMNFKDTYGRIYYDHLSNIEADKISLRLAKLVLFDDLNYHHPDLDQIPRTANQIARVAIRGSLFERTLNELTVSADRNDKIRLLRQAIQIALYAAAPTIWFSSPDFQLQYQTKPEEAIGLVQKTMEAAVSKPLVIDAIDQFVDIALMQTPAKMAYFIDDNGDFLYHLHLMQAYLEINPNLTVIVIAKNGRFAIDANHDDVLHELAQSDFEELRKLQQAGRFEVVKDGPEYAGINLRHISSDLARKIIDADLTVAVGQTAVENLNGIKQSSFMMSYVDSVTHQNVSGLPRGSLYFATTKKGKTYFRYGSGRFDLTLKDAASHRAESRTNEDKTIVRSKLSRGSFSGSRLYVKAPIVTPAQFSRRHFLLGGLAAAFSMGMSSIVNGQTAYEEERDSYSSLIPAQQLAVKNAIKGIRKQVEGFPKGLDREKLLEFLSEDHWSKRLFVTRSDTAKHGGKGFATDEDITIDLGTFRQLVANDTIGRQIAIPTLLHEFIHYTHFNTDQHGGDQEENNTRAQSITLMGGVFQIHRLSGVVYGGTMIRNENGSLHIDPEQGVPLFFVNAYENQLPEKFVDDMEKQALIEELNKNPSKEIKEGIQKRLNQLGVKPVRSEMRTHHPEVQRLVNELNELDREHREFKSSDAYDVQRWDFFDMMRHYKINTFEVQKDEDYFDDVLMYAMGHPNYRHRRGVSKLIADLYLTPLRVVKVFSYATIEDNFLRPMGVMDLYGLPETKTGRQISREEITHKKRLALLTPMMYFLVRRPETLILSSGEKFPSYEHVVEIRQEFFRALGKEKDRWEQNAQKNEDDLVSRIQTGAPLLLSDESKEMSWLEAMLLIYLDYEKNVNIEGKEEKDAQKEIIHRGVEAHSEVMAIVKPVDPEIDLSPIINRLNARLGLSDTKSKDPVVFRAESRAANAEIISMMRQIAGSVGDDAGTIIERLDQQTLPADLRREIINLIFRKLGKLMTKPDIKEIVGASSDTEEDTFSGTEAEFYIKQMTRVVSFMRNHFESEDLDLITQAIDENSKAKMASNLDAIIGIINQLRRTNFFVAAQEQPRSYREFLEALSANSDEADTYSHRRKYWVTHKNLAAFENVSSSAFPRTKVKNMIIFWLGNLLAGDSKPTLFHGPQLSVIDAVENFYLHPDQGIAPAELAQFLSALYKKGFFPDIKIRAQTGVNVPADVLGAIAESVLVNYADKESWDAASAQVVEKSMNGFNWSVSPTLAQEGRPTLVIDVRTESRAMTLAPDVKVRSEMRKGENSPEANPGFGDEEIAGLFRAVMPDLSRESNEIETFDMGGPGIFIARSQGGKDKQQDEFTQFTVSSTAGEWVILAVMDGSGELGSEMSRQAAEIIEDAFDEKLRSLKSFEELTEKAIQEIFEEIQIRLIQSHARAEASKKDLIDGGTTASVVIMAPFAKKVIMATVGDSPVLLFDEKNKLMAHSPFQNLSNPVEFEAMRQRILGRPEFSLDDGKVKWIEPADADAKQRHGFGLATTGYLGAIHLGDVLRRDPVIQTFAMPENGHLVMGSDGMLGMFNAVQAAPETQEAWEKRLLEEVNKIAAHLTGTNPAKNLIERLNEPNESGIYDNTTVATVNFDLLLSRSESRKILRSILGVESLIALFAPASFIALGSFLVGVISYDQLTQFSVFTERIVPWLLGGHAINFLIEKYQKEKSVVLNKKSARSVLFFSEWWPVYVLASLAISMTFRSGSLFMVYAQRFFEKVGDGAETWIDLNSEPRSFDYWDGVFSAVGLLTGVFSWIVHLYFNWTAGEVFGFVTSAFFWGMAGLMTAFSAYEQLKGQTQDNAPKLLEAQKRESGVRSKRAETRGEDINKVIAEVRDKLMGAENALTLYFFNRIIANDALDDEVVRLIGEFIDTPRMDLILENMARAKDVTLLGYVGELYHAHELKNRGYRIVAMGIPFLDASGGQFLEADYILEKGGKYYFGESKFFPGRRNYGTESNRYAPLKDWLSRNVLDNRKGARNKFDRYKVMLNELRNGQGNVRLSEKTLRGSLEGKDANALLAQLRNETKNVPIVYALSEEIRFSITASGAGVITEEGRQVPLEDALKDANSFGNHPQEISFALIESMPAGFSTEIEFIPYRLLSKITDISRHYGMPKVNRVIEAVPELKRQINQDIVDDLMKTVPNLWRSAKGKTKIQKKERWDQLQAFFESILDKEFAVDALVNAILEKKPEEFAENQKETLTKFVIRSFHIRSESHSHRAEMRAETRKLSAEEKKELKEYIENQTLVPLTFKDGSENLDGNFVEAVMGADDFPYVVKIPRSGNQSEYERQVEDAKAIMGDLIAPFTVLSNVRIGTATYPWVVVQKRMLVFDEEKPAEYLDKEYVMPSGTKINLWEQERVLLLSLVKRGIQIKDSWFKGNYGVDPDTGKLMFVDMMAPKWEYRRNAFHGLLPQYKHEHPRKFKSEHMLYKWLIPDVAEHADQIGLESDDDLYQVWGTEEENVREVDDVDFVSSKKADLKTRLSFTDQLDLTLGQGIELSSGDIRQYLVAKNPQYLQGRKFYLRKLTRDQFLKFVEASKKAVQGDAEWRNDPARNPYHDIGAEHAADVLPKFKDLSSDNVALVSVAGGEERLEGFLDFQIEAHWNAEQIKHDGQKIFIPKFEIYYRHIGKNGDIKGISDLLIDFVIKLAVSPESRVTGGLEMNAINQGSAKFANRRDWRPVDPQNRPHALAISQQALVSYAVTEKLADRFNRAEMRQTNKTQDAYQKALSLAEQVRTPVRERINQLASQIQFEDVASAGQAITEFKTAAEAAKKGPNPINFADIHFKNMRRGDSVQRAVISQFFSENGDSLEIDRILSRPERGWTVYQYFYVLRRVTTDKTIVVGYAIANPVLGRRGSWATKTDGNSGLPVQMKGQNIGFDIFPQFRGQAEMNSKKLFQAALAAIYAAEKQETEYFEVGATDQIFTTSAAAEPEVMINFYSSTGFLPPFAEGEFMEMLEAQAAGNSFRYSGGEGSAVEYLKGKGREPDGENWMQWVFPMTSSQERMADFAQREPIWYSRTFHGPDSFRQEDDGPRAEMRLTELQVRNIVDDLYLEFFAQGIPFIVSNMSGYGSYREGFNYHPNAIKSFDIIDLVFRKHDFDGKGIYLQDKKNKKIRLAQKSFDAIVEEISRREMAALASPDLVAPITKPRSELRLGQDSRLAELEVHAKGTPTIVAAAMAGRIFLFTLPFAPGGLSQMRAQAGLKVMVQILTGTDEAVEAALQEMGLSQDRPSAVVEVLDRPITEAEIAAVMQTLMANPRSHFMVFENNGALAPVTRKFMEGRFQIVDAPSGRSSGIIEGAVRKWSMQFSGHIVLAGQNLDRFISGLNVDNLKFVLYEPVVGEAQYTGARSAVMTAIGQDSQSVSNIVTAEKRNGRVIQHIRSESFFRLAQLLVEAVARQIVASAA